MTDEIVEQIPARNGVKTNLKNHLERSLLVLVFLAVAKENRNV